ncbi:LOW QUALITY PROTEIN: CMRF35-like molecule 5 [Pipistrellus kuhlii]|uniref:LOW QUALITY PROTEIN: CMRF35-like molecule 5 n=1 Tax=Pipistrellus kuhlii TaxID=59472 RepID=UPI00174F75CC|nr:LOW QUALITY PROTEIN: CMRF35-like molecule 5 [Pipistrellus kuhlii]
MWLLPPLLLLIVPGCFSMSGPGSVSGPRGGSATIQCRYDPGYESYSKWWCRGEAWGSCHTLLKTTGSDWMVRSGRMSIQDNHHRHLFTVTMEELRASDQDAYWCGIERPGIDLGHQVRVYVGPALPVITQPAELETTGMTELTSLYTAESVTETASVSLATSPPIAQSSNSSIALTRSLTRFLLCNLHVVLLTVIKVPLLGGLLCTLMWRSRSQGTPRGNQSVFAGDRSPHAIETLARD